MNEKVATLDEVSEDTQPWVDPDQPEKTDILNVKDRCDLCGSQAYVGVLFETGELMFCGHHYHEFEAKISEVSVKVIDERWKLTPVRLDVNAP